MRIAGQHRKLGDLARWQTSGECQTGEKKIPGAVGLIARRGKIAYMETFGMADIEAGKPMRPDTIHRIYSMSKPITSVAVMMLYEEGRFQLNDPVANYLPEFAKMQVGVEEKDPQTGQPVLKLVPAKRPITIRDLLRATLRHRPDRIIVGEVRGGEAFDLLQALNTGHSGSLSTIHANSAEQALARFASCVVQSGIDLPYQAVRYQIADAINLVLHLERRLGNRMTQELIRVERYDAQRDGYNKAVLFPIDPASDAPPVVM